MSPEVLPVYRRGLITLLCLLVCVDRTMVFASVSLAQRDEISNFIGEMITCRNIAGLTLTVVFGDGSDPADVFTKGFGYSDVRGNKPVTNETLFALGSLTTTFTTTLVAKLLNKQKQRYPLGWDMTIREVLGGDFKLYDCLRTDHASLRDLAAHKMGYPNYDTMNAGLDPSHSRREYCSRYHLLKPAYGFRGEYHYSREMYALLGCAAEALGGGATWEDLVRSYLLQPLQMTSTQFYEGAQNLATPYFRYNGSFLAMNLDVWKGIYPAEAADAIVSNAQDMPKWIHYHIMNVANMSRVQEGAVLEETYRPQIQHKLKDMKYFAPSASVEETVFAHNLGWDSGRYRGFRFIQQKGELPGFSSKLIIFRDMQLGIYLSMNSATHKNKGLSSDIITWYIADLLLHSGRPLFMTPRSACRPKFETPFAHDGTMAPNSYSRNTAVVPSSEGQKTPRETGWEAKYVGQYGNQLFGNVTISYDPAGHILRYQCGRIATGILIETDNVDQFQIRLIGPLKYLSKMDPGQQMLRFEKIADGRYTKVWPSEHLLYERDVMWGVAQARIKNINSDCLDVTSSPPTANINSDCLDVTSSPPTATSLSASIYFWNVNSLSMLLAVLSFCML